MKEIDIFTDGACINNPGPGGWAAVLRFKEEKKEVSGGHPKTTNNRMELTAVIKALEQLKEPCKVNVYSDSKYICDAISKGWVKSWKKRGWIKSDKKPVLNSDLWEQLIKLIEINYVNIFWIKGHNGHPENERCDELAVRESKKMRWNL